MSSIEKLNSVCHYTCIIWWNRRNILRRILASKGRTTMMFLRNFYSVCGWCFPSWYLEALPYSMPMYYDDCRSWWPKITMSLMQASCLFILSLGETKSKFYRSNSIAAVIISRLLSFFLLHLPNGQVMHNIGDSGCPSPVPHLKGTFWVFLGGVWCMFVMDSLSYAELNSFYS